MVSSPADGMVMKVLVLSDSHSALSMMRRSIEAVRPDLLIHLGDHYDDALAIEEDHPGLPMYKVPGNCDAYRVPDSIPLTLIEKIGGVRIYMTHGHMQHVKQTTLRLEADARAVGAAAVLYGHTHRPDCRQEADGLWVLNPGSCGYYGGSVGLMEIADGRILSCRILRDEDLEQMQKEKTAGEQ